MDDELKFVEGLYDDAEGETKDIFEQQKKARDELLNQIALVMLTYTVIDGVMRLSRGDKIKEYSRLSKLIKSSCKATGKAQEDIINNILTKTANNTFDFYSYNKGLKDVQAIIDKNFKGKHFSDRIWENENQVASHLHKQVNDFLQGKVNVNQIKSNVEKIYNTSAYNAKRLVETEVARVENDSFKRFCNETGVKKVRRNAMLDNRTCNDCSSFNGKVYELRDAPDLPAHPLCRCFYEIVDNEIVHKISGNKENSNSANVIVDKDTVNECSEKIKSLGVNSVDVRHIMNGEVLAPFVEELEKLKDEYGEMFNRIESIDISENTIAQLNGKVLQLNQRYFNDNELLQKQLSDWLKVKYIPSGCDNIKYVATHEYMHLLTQDTINPRSKAAVIYNRASTKDFICKNAINDPYEFVADLLAANRLTGIKNKSINQLLKLFGGV